MSALNTDALIQRLVHEEGMAKRDPAKPGRLFPYKDSKGIETIGVGRNLKERGISDAEAMVLLRNDIAEHTALLDKYLPWWRDMDAVRQLAFADLAFNLGVGPSDEQPEGKLLGFHGTLDAFRTGDYEVAAKHLEATGWYTQVGPRGPSVVALVRTGEMAA